MKGLILAAGYGTRLYPLTIDKPKPLLEVGGKPIMSRLMEKLEEVDSCNEVYVITNDRFYDVSCKWQGENSYKFPVDVINDGTKSNDDRLGAIGDIKLVLDEKQPKEDILIMAGDNLFEFDIMDFISFAEGKGRMCIALFDIKDIVLAEQYGIVALGEDNIVDEFQEKPVEPRSTLASTGIYYVPADKLYAYGEYMQTGNSKDAPGNFVKWMAENDGVYGYVFNEGWYDIGDTESLKKADEEYRSKGI